MNIYSKRTTMAAYRYRDTYKDRDTDETQQTQAQPHNDNDEDTRHKHHAGINETQQNKDRRCMWGPLAGRQTETETTRDKDAGDTWQTNRASVDEDLLLGSNEAFANAFAEIRQHLLLLVVLEYMVY